MIHCWQPALSTQKGSAIAGGGNFYLPTLASAGAGVIERHLDWPTNVHQRRQSICLWG